MNNSAADRRLQLNEDLQDVGGSYAQGWCCVGVITLADAGFTVIVWPEPCATTGPHSIDPTSPRFDLEPWFRSVRVPGRSTRDVQSPRRRLS